MPKARVTIPLELDLTDAEADTVRGVVDVARRAKDSGIVDAARSLFGAVGRVAKERRASRRSRR